jgi:hypothetical protein
LVVSNMNFISISYMGCHPSHWRTHIFKMVKTTYQIYVPIYFPIFSLNNAVVLQYFLGKHPNWTCIIAMQDMSPKVRSCFFCAHLTVDIGHFVKR